MPKDDVQRSWTEVETYELIEHVSHHRCLYESQNAQYKNVLVKTQAKAKIASNFANCDPNQAFAKWLLLKTRYQREKKKENEIPPSGSRANTGSYKSEWMFMEPMSFLEKHVKQRVRTSNLKKSAQSSGIAKLKPLSPPDVVITDDDADSVMIDGKKYFIDENDEKDSTSSISKKVVELCPEFLSGNCSEASPKYDDSENTDDKDPLSDDEAQPGTSSCLSPKVKKTSSMSSAKQSNFPQSSNKDGKTKEVQGLTQGVKENSIDDSKPNPYKKKKKNPVMAVDEKIDSALTAMGSFFSSRITTEPPSKILPEICLAVDPVLTDWLVYCSTFAKRVASIDDEEKRDEIRYEMEGMLYQHLKAYNNAKKSA